MSGDTVGPDAAAAAIGAALAWDLSYLAPPADRHFDPVSAAEGAGSIILMAYLGAFVDTIRHRAAQLGEKTANALIDRIGAFFAGTAPPSRGEVAQAMREARDAAAADSARAAESADAAEAAILQYLTGRHLPEAAAQDIAAIVRHEAAVEPPG
jgi:hypothetical protein